MLGWEKNEGREEAEADKGGNGKTMVVKLEDKHTGQWENGLEEHLGDGERQGNVKTRELPLTSACPWLHSHLSSPPTGPP